MRVCAKCSRVASGAVKHWDEVGCMNDDELESQLSAMFDGELSAAECELLARRLSRDEHLRHRWSSYALIGAVLRNEPLPVRQALGGRPVADLAARVTAALEAGAVGGDVADVAEGASSNGVAVRAAAPRSALRWRRWAWPVGGVATAAAVAFVAISLVRVSQPDDGFVADRLATPGVANAAEDEVVIAGGAAPRMLASAVPRATGSSTNLSSGVALDAARPGGSGEPESYVVPVMQSRPGSAPTAQLVNYFVAHGEVAAPLARRSALAALVAGESTPVVTVSADEEQTRR